MKRFIKDRMLYMLTMLLIAICVPFIWDFAVAILLSAVIIVSTAYLCRSVLLLPIDMLKGAVSEKLCFIGVGGLEIELFRQPSRKPFEKWKFRRKDGSTILLIAPETLDGKLQTSPPKDKTITVTYYKYSKILKSIEE